MTRILIAEDERNLISFLEKALRAAGYVTTTVTDGAAAVALARDEDFELLILDLGLPILDEDRVVPGFELDARCPFCDSGCSVCKQTRWIELLPCGLVHPNVLSAYGVDPEEWSGFAFGLGLSRLVMLRFGINDVRLLLGGDLRFLEQF